MRAAPPLVNKAHGMTTTEDERYLRRPHCGYNSTRNLDARFLMAVTPLDAPPPEPIDVRDFISSMSGELAQLARESGDRRLAVLLDTAATFAEIRDGASISRAR